MTTSQRPVGLLRSGAIEGETAIVARSLGFRTDIRFQVLAWTPPDEDAVQSPDRSGVPSVANR